MAHASLAISIPAYNEAATLEPLVRESLSVLERHTSDSEVLIVDDGSTDPTGAIADRLAREDPRVRVIHHAKNMGFGATLREVMTLPQKEWVFFIPGDGQISPQELDRLWPWREKADFILGWRTHRQDPMSRRFAAAVYNLLISAVLGRRIHDVDSVVLFRRSIAQRLTLSATSVFLHAEFCLKAVQQGARLVEVPIEHRARTAGQPKGNRPAVVWATFRELVSYVRDQFFSRHLP